METLMSLTILTTNASLERLQQQQSGKAHLTKRNSEGSRLLPRCNSLSGLALTGMSPIFSVAFMLHILFKWPLSLKPVWLNSSFIIEVRLRGLPLKPGWLRQAPGRVGTFQTGSGRFRRILSDPGQAWKGLSVPSGLFLASPVSLGSIGALRSCLFSLPGFSCKS